MKGSSKCESIWDSKNLIIFWLYRVVCFHVSMLKPMMYEDFLGVWLLTKVQWTAPPNCMLGTWKLPNTLQKHPSLLSSKHATSALYFCALWFVILDLYSSCWIKDIANSVSPTCLDCYSSQTSLIKVTSLTPKSHLYLCPFRSLRRQHTGAKQVVCGDITKKHEVNIRGSVNVTVNLGYL